MTDGAEVNRRSEICHIESLSMFGSVFRSSVQAWIGEPSVPQQVMTDGAQWELRCVCVRVCIWTATTQLRKVED